MEGFFFFSTLIGIGIAVIGLMIYTVIKEVRR